MSESSTEICNYLKYITSNIIILNGEINKLGIGDDKVIQEEIFILKKGTLFYCNATFQPSDYRV